MNEGINMEVQDTKNQGIVNNSGNNLAANNGIVVAPGEKGKFTKVIKRYQNRKLYDTHQSCYVTLDEIADMIVRGEEVMVIDNRTKKDITSSTLTQIIFEKQKRSKTLIPVMTLRKTTQK
jgi:polyhydroxyalkanoate synthesis repressor PhaR